MVPTATTRGLGLASTAASRGLGLASTAPTTGLGLASTAPTQWFRTDMQYVGVYLPLVAVVTVCSLHLV